MKREFIANLRCPWCQSSGITLRADQESAAEVRAGELRCPGCERSFAIRQGVADFLDPANEALAREVAGWLQLAGELDENLVPDMTALPHLPRGPWPHVAPDFFQIFEYLGFGGLRVVDLGAGRTWSSRYLATIGRAREVVAVDVLTTRFLGLETADIYFERDGIYFERLRADMHRLPLPDGWADSVFSCASIHHAVGLDAVFAEAWRVLRPGGFFVFVSEPVKREALEATRPDNAETAAGINENFYTLDEYESALQRVGFHAQRLVPRSIRYRLLYPDSTFESGMSPQILRWAHSSWGRLLINRLLHTRAGGRWLYRNWNLPLSMVAFKRR